MTGDDCERLLQIQRPPPPSTRSHFEKSKCCCLQAARPQIGSGNNNHPPPGYLRTLICLLGSCQSHGSRIDRHPKSPIYGFYTLRMNQGPLQAHYSAIIGEYLYSLNWTTCLHQSAPIRLIDPTTWDESHVELADGRIVFLDRPTKEMRPGPGAQKSSSFCTAPVSILG